MRIPGRCGAMRAILVVLVYGEHARACGQEATMSTPNGPSWYPSKQFVHSPEPPAGAPPAPRPDASPATTHEPGTLRRFVDRLLRR
jgi:hypothetical protein